MFGYSKIKPRIPDLPSSGLKREMFRLFLMLKSSVQAIKNGCLLCIEVDGVFMKHRSYNGTSLLALGMSNTPN